MKYAIKITMALAMVFALLVAANAMAEVLNPDPNIQISASKTEVLVNEELHVHVSAPGAVGTYWFWGSPGNVTDDDAAEAVFRNMISEGDENDFVFTVSTDDFDRKWFGIAEYPDGTIGISKTISVSVIATGELPAPEINGPTHVKANEPFTIEISLSDVDKISRLFCSVVYFGDNTDEGVEVFEFQANINDGDEIKNSYELTIENGRNKGSYEVVVAIVSYEKGIKRAGNRERYIIMNDDKPQIADDGTGFGDYNGGLYFLKDGKVVEEANGLIQDPNNAANWYYCALGRAQTQYSGLAEYGGEWFYLENGKLNTVRAGLVTYDGGRFMIAAGRILREVNGLIQDPNTSKWYYVAAGQVADYTGLVQYDGAWFYVQNGELAVNYSGNVEYDGAVFSVVNGQVV